MGPGLSLQQAPPLSVPTRFFLSLPVFGMAAGVLLAIEPGLLAGRWSPATLALTHLLTLGMLGMAMCGALLQMLPVLAGSPVTAPLTISRWVHALLTVGTLALVCGLWLDLAWAMRLALVGLGLGFAIFSSAIGQALWRAPRRQASIDGMRIALLGLLVTVGLGLLLAAGHGFDGIPLWREPLTRLHLGWGVIGWVGLLLIAIAFQLVPMLQMTAEYPAALRHWLIPCCLFGLLLWSLGTAHTLPLARAAAALGEAMVGIGLASAAITTLRLQARRRRRGADVTLDFWRLAMLCGLAGIGLYAALRFELVDAAAHWPMLLGVLLLVGFALAAVNGMLYKILPFLCWFHLQSVALAHAPDQPVPGMRSLLPPALARWQYRLFIAGLGVLCLATLVPNPASGRLAGIALILNQALLGANLLLALRRFRRSRQQIESHRVD